MPVAPPKPCAYFGCRELVSRGQSRCAEHERANKDRTWKEQDRLRGTASQRGYDNRWARYSRDYRARYPLCVTCMSEGRVTPSEHTDHIVPISGPHDPRFYDESNLQALCAHHHRVKTAKEDGGFGNNRKEE